MVSTWLNPIAAAEELVRLTGPFEFSDVTRHSPEFERALVRRGCRVRWRSHFDEWALLNDAELPHCDLLGAPPENEKLLFPFLDHVGKLRAGWFLLRVDYLIADKFLKYMTRTTDVFPINRTFAWYRIGTIPADITAFHPKRSKR